VKERGIRINWNALVGLLVVVLIIAVVLFLLSWLLDYSNLSS
jgi:hypothetical protein